MKLMNKVMAGVKSGLRKAVDFVDRRAPQAVATVVAVITLVGGAVARAQTDATVIATNAQTAFAVIAPITIPIAGFYVILKIAKKVVH